MFGDKNPVAKTLTSKEYRDVMKCLKENCSIEQKLLDKHKELDRLLGVNSSKSSKASKASKSSENMGLQQSDAILDIVTEILKLTNKKKILECKYEKCQTELINANKAKTKEVIKKIQESKKMLAFFGDMAKNIEKPKSAKKAKKTKKATRKTKSAKN